MVEVTTAELENEHAVCLFELFAAVSVRHVAAQCFILLSCRFQAYRACLPKSKNCYSKALQGPSNQVIHIADHCNIFLQTKENNTCKQ